MTATSTIRTSLLNFYVEKLGFLECKGAGLLSDTFPHTFTPSVGHPEAIQAVSAEQIPKLRCVIQDVCFRAIDQTRVGFGPHLSLFEMSVSLSIAEFTREACYREITSAFTTLTTCLGLNPNDLYITVFPGARILGTSIPRDDWSPETWHRLGVPKNNIVPAPGDACVLVPDTANEPAGVRSEVFYQPPDGRPPFEIATIEFLQFRTVASKGKRSLASLPGNLGLFATAYGIERLAVALNNYDSVFDVDDVRALVERIVEVVGFPTFYQLQPYPFRIFADAYRGAKAIFQAGQHLDNSRRGQVLRSVLARLRRSSNELGVQPKKLVEGLLSEEEANEAWSLLLTKALD